MVKEKADGAIKVDIVDFLKTIRKGFLLFETANKLEELTKAIRETGKGGKLSIDISVEPLKKGSPEIVQVKGTVSAKIPKKDIESGIYYTSEDNTLLRDDPRQETMSGEGFDSK